MATRFELVMHGDNPVALRAAGEEALNEIERLENQLSLYRSSSEIAQVNARAASEAVRVTPEMFALLRHAAQLSEETGGAFDITIAPLARCWGFMDGSGKMPSPEELAAAREVVGMGLVQLDERHSTVRFARRGVMLDLGAIGKGYAIERAAGFLRDAGVTCALLHGGTSTVCAIGAPLEADCWRIAVNTPPAPEHLSLTRPVTVTLKDESLSVSAIWGRSFESGGKTFGHVIDPRNGQPVKGALLAAVVLPSATEADALSTALLTLGGEGFNAICALRSQAKAILAVGDEQGCRFLCRGFDVAVCNDLAVENSLLRD